MKRVTALSICAILLIVSFSGCKAKVGPRPNEFLGSRWVSEDPPAEFVVKDSGVNQRLFLTLNGETKEYIIGLDDGFTSSVDICTLNPNPNYRYEFKDILTIGIGTFKPDKFIFTVTNDISGLLEGYKEIVFYRDFEYEKNLKEQE